MGPEMRVGDFHLCRGLKELEFGRFGLAVPWCSVAWWIGCEDCVDCGRLILVGEVGL